MSYLALDVELVQVLGKVFVAGKIGKRVALEAGMSAIKNQ